MYSVWRDVDGLASVGGSGCEWRDIHEEGKRMRSRILGSVPLFCSVKANFDLAGGVDMRGIEQSGRKAHNFLLPSTRTFGWVFLGRMR